MKSKQKQPMSNRKRSWLRNDLTLQIVRCINSKFWYFQVKTQQLFLQVQVGFSDGGVRRPSDHELVEASVELNHLAAVPWHADLRNAQWLKAGNLELRNAILNDRENSFEHLWKWCGESVN